MLSNNDVDNAGPLNAISGSVFVRAQESDAKSKCLSVFPRPPGKV